MFGNTTVHFLFAIFLLYKKQKSSQINTPRGATVDCKSNSVITLDERAELMTQFLHERNGNTHLLRPSHSHNCEKASVDLCTALAASKIFGA